jgi:thiamine-phosphate diphosphorylase / hydroxyethylthiazole kinase
MTGVTDYVTDGHTVFALSNGHPLLGAITGSGCMVGTAVATLIGAAHMASSGAEPGRLYGGDPLLAAVAAVLVVTIASERAAAGANVRGLGTFLPALLDELAAFTPEMLRAGAKVKIL